MTDFPKTFDEFLALYLPVLESLSLSLEEKHLAEQEAKRLFSSYWKSFGRPAVKILLCLAPGFFERRRIVSAFRKLRSEEIASIKNKKSVSPASAPAPAPPAQAELLSPSAAAALLSPGRAGESNQKEK